MNEKCRFAASGFTPAAAFLLIGIPASCISNVAAQDADETTTGILAARVRQQGYACSKAQKAQRDQKQSRPNETVWLLSCESGAYRIRLIPDMGSKIERLKTEQNKSQKN